jgi:hypothetical protein
MKVQIVASSGSQRETGSRGPTRIKCVLFAVCGEPIQDGLARTMITEIPASKDFEDSGIGFLNHAWCDAMDILLAFDDSGFDDTSTFDVEREEFWQATQRQLTTAAALAQQGTELLLKARIASVSPFLLFSGDPQKWPAGSAQKDMAFADFRTIDAQDLIRVHDTVWSSRVSDQFRQRFEEFRKLRNSFFHTVDHRIKVKADDLIRLILLTSHDLIGSQQWLSQRRKRLTGCSDGFSDGDCMPCVMTRELHKLISILTSSELLTHIGFHRKIRRYTCQACKWRCADWSIETNCAQLVPNTPGSTNLHCFACGQNTTVVREDCGKNGCKSNVIDPEYGCCICGEEGDA